jgi:hypothetical protein
MGTIVPTRPVLAEWPGWEARTLEEFRGCPQRPSHASLYYRFIASRLRLQLRTNDFSQWLSGNLGADGPGAA